MEQLVLLVYNIQAGTFRMRYHLRRLANVLKSAGYHVDEVSLPQLSAARELLTSCNAVIVAGGDGTLNSVVAQVMKEDLKEPPSFVVLPWGTSNDLAQQINRGCCTPREVLSCIERSETIWLDIGQVNDRYFVNVVAAGMFADVAYLTGRRFKALIGKSAYYLHALSRVSTYRPFRLQASFDGNFFDEEVLLFGVLNSGRAGGGFRVREATPRDGRLHLVAIKSGLTIHQLWGVLQRLLRADSLDHPNIIYVTAKDLRLRFPPEIPLVIDGERGPPPPLQLSILPERLPFIGIVGESASTKEFRWEPLRQGSRTLRR